MPALILATKLYAPPPRPRAVVRSRLIEQLNMGFQPGRKLTLVSAPAGIGKTTLLSAWLAVCGRPAAWLSLDEGDNDPARFLTYFIIALQRIAADIGTATLGLLQSPQPQAIEALLPVLVNEIAEIPRDCVLILDDYHLIDSRPVDHALDFLLEHFPPQIRLVIATREDPQLPLARYRVRDQLTELRAGDLRFTLAESTEFLNHGMGLSLSTEDISGLEERTEGWIAGLQLAALSMQGHADTSGFIRSFTGSHRFVLDYLLEEVLQRQSESIQNFLIQTSILDRLCGPLCDAVCNCETDLERGDADPSSSGAAGQATLEYLERANLFLVPLDNERGWYRYHHLFADLLRQRLLQRQPEAKAELHIRASQWFEDHHLEIEAFQHAAAANDIQRAARLVQGKGMPLHLRGGLFLELKWLEALPARVLNERPILWLMYSGALTTAGQTVGVEEKLQAAEAALQGAEMNADTKDLIGRIANNRATLAITHYDPDETIRQAQRALANLRPDNLPVRAITTWTLAVAYQFKGERSKATRTFTEAISASQAIGQTFVTKLATSGLGNLQESDNKLHLAAQTYQHALELFGDPPLLFATEAYLGLARIFYEWNDLGAAQRHAEQALDLARQYSDIIDRYILCELFLARVLLAKGYLSGAVALVKQADQATHQHHFTQRLPEVVGAQVMMLLRQGNLAEAEALAQTQPMPLIQARVFLARGDLSKALEVLAVLREDLQAKDWLDELLKVTVLQAVAYQAHGEKDKALYFLGEALVMAEEGGFIRTFIDEGAPMAQLLSEAGARGIPTEYVRKLLAVFATEQHSEGQSTWPPTQPLIEPLSQRELEILRLIAQGLSNREISQKLFLALDTVKGHNRAIFEKLQVQNRTGAAARAREMGLL